jgi:hypothetical protein
MSIHLFIYRKKSFIFLFFISLTSFSQQIGDGVATHINDFSLPLSSGLYQGASPIGTTPDVSHPWQHLFVLRHSNLSNNHQLQIGSSYNTNDRLFFRKIAAGLQSSSPDWIEVATRGTNNFVGDQIVNGKLKIIGNFNIDGPNTNDAINFESQNGFHRIAFNELRFWDWEYGETMTINNGNIGVGTITPVSKLDVRGIISTPEIAFRNADGGDDSDPYRLRKVQGSSNVNWLELQLNDDFNESFRIYGNSCAGFGCGEYSGNLYHSFDAGGNVFHSGNVGIGTTSPAFKLDVIGTIRSREVKVDMNGADFVFEEKYLLMPLSELETYIKKNKHLPEIATAKEMQEQGSNLGDLNTKLLQKIEELTLYTIEQNKKIITLEKKMEKMESALK